MVDSIKLSDSEFKCIAIQKDYAQVVHCSECKYCYDYGIHFCRKLNMYCPDVSEFYCKYGAKMDITLLDRIDRALSEDE